MVVEPWRNEASGMLATEKNAAAGSCKLPACCLDRGHSKSGGAVEAGAGPQGQNLARGWGPPKTTAATTDQVQAEKADSVGKGAERMRE